MPELLFILVPVFVMAIAVLAYHAHAQAKARREALAAFAFERGWHFRPQRDSSWDDRYPQFGWFTTGHSRYGYNLIHGSLSIQGKACSCALGDYTYKVTRGSGKRRRTTTYRFSFLLVELPFERLPQLAVRPEGFFDRLTALIGLDDIDFESEEFSRKFHVKSSDKRFAYDLLHPRMMEFMLDSSPPNFEIEREVYCARSPNGCWDVDELAQQVEWCETWFANWPEHVLADLDSRVVR